MPLTKHPYYPTYDHGCTPIHEVKNWCYVRKLVRAVRRGETVNPILIDGSPRNGTLLTGTHRSAANDLLNMLGDSRRIAVMSIQDMDLTDDQQEAIDNLEYDRIDWYFDR